MTTIEISQAQINSFIVDFNNTDFSKLDYKKYKIVDFIGFDAFAIVKALLKKRDELKITDSDLKEDILWILAITLKKGSITKNNKDKMSKEGKAEVDRLIAKYSIQFSAGRGSSPDIITFTRVLAAFPIAALNMLSVIGPRTISAGPFGSAVLPLFMQHQVFASVIPRKMNSEVITFVKTLILAFSCDTSVISQSSKMGTPKIEELSKIASQQVTFINAAYLAAYPGESVRTAFCKGLDWKSIYNNKTKALYLEMQKSFFKDLPDLDWLVVDAEGSTIFTGAINEETVV